jgi:hypothetical protein
VNAVSSPSHASSSSGDVTSVFAAGDYFHKNGHLYFVLDYLVGGFIVENCQTYCSLPVTYDYMREGVTFIARDSSYKRTKSRRGE